jgi:hypothetical protein
MERRQSKSGKLNKFARPVLKFPLTPAVRVYSAGYAEKRPAFLLYIKE